MTNQGLEKWLTKRCEKLQLKQKALKALDELFLPNVDGDNFLASFERDKIKTLFDHYQYRIDKGMGNSIRTRVNLLLEKPEPSETEYIADYTYETDFNGKFLDQWLTVEEKRTLDTRITEEIEYMNEILPVEYLNAKYVQYEFVVYLSLIGILLVSKKLEETRETLQMAYTFLEKTNPAIFEKEYLKRSRRFLRIIKQYLAENSLVVN